MITLAAFPTIVAAVRAALIDSGVPASLFVDPRSVVMDPNEVDNFQIAEKCAKRLQDQKLIDLMPMNKIDKLEADYEDNALEQFATGEYMTMMAIIDHGGEGAQTLHVILDQGFDGSMSPMFAKD